MMMLRLGFSLRRVRTAAPPRRWFVSATASANPNPNASASASASARAGADATVEALKRRDLAVLLQLKGNTASLKELLDKRHREHPEDADTAHHRYEAADLLDRIDAELDGRFVAEMQEVFSELQRLLLGDIKVNRAAIFEQLKRVDSLRERRAKLPYPDVLERSRTKWENLEGMYLGTRQAFNGFAGPEELFALWSPLIFIAIGVVVLYYEVYHFSALYQAQEHVLVAMEEPYLEKIDAFQKSKNQAQAAILELIDEAEAKKTKPKDLAPKLLRAVAAVKP